MIDFVISSLSEINAARMQCMRDLLVFASFGSWLNLQLKAQVSKQLDLSTQAGCDKSHCSSNISSLTDSRRHLRTRYIARHLGLKLLQPSSCQHWMVAWMCDFGDGDTLNVRVLLQEYACSSHTQRKGLKC